MLSKRSISTIPYESLPEKIQDYLREELEIFHDEWEDDLDAETQYLCIEMFSNEMTDCVATSSSSSSASSRSSAAAVSVSGDRGTVAAEEKSQRNISPLPIIDTIALHNLFHQMDTKSLAAFAKSSFYARNLTQPILDQIAVKKVFEHIRDGAIDKVKKMLDTNPRLALIEWKAAKGKEDEKVFANKAGQLISVADKTAYEFALGEEDTEIAAELYACIVKVSDQEVANTLFHKQRPDGWEEEEAKKSTPIFTQLDELTQAIRNAQPGDIISSGDPDYRLTVREDSVRQALAQFRLMLDTMLKAPVTTGRHFNPNLLLRAFQIYDDHYEDYFGNDLSDPKAMLFWQQAIGYIQRFMPANFVQAFCDGLYNTNEKLQKSVPQGRSLRFQRYDSGHRDWFPSDFYPLSDSRLGFDFAIYATRRAAVGAWWSGGRPVVGKLHFEAYVNQKQQAYRTYSAPRPTR